MRKEQNNGNEDQPEFHWSMEPIRTGWLEYLQDTEQSSIIEKECMCANHFLTACVSGSKGVGSVSKLDPKKRNKLDSSLG